MVQSAAAEKLASKMGAAPPHTQHRCRNVAGDPRRVRDVQPHHQPSVSILQFTANNSPPRLHQSNQNIKQNEIVVPVAPVVAPVHRRRQTVDDAAKPDAEEPAEPVEPKRNSCRCSRPQQTPEPSMTPRNQTWENQPSPPNQKKNRNCWSRRSNDGFRACSVSQSTQVPQT